MDVRGADGQEDGDKDMREAVCIAPGGISVKQRQVVMLDGRVSTDKSETSWAYMDLR